MQQVLKNIIFSTTEYQNFGLNSVTILFVITVLMALFLQLPGLYDQARTIWRNKSATGVNTSTFVIFLTYFLVFVIYGYSVSSGAVMLTGSILTIPQIFILIGIFRFNKFRWHYGFTTLVATVLITLTAVLPNSKEELFTITSIATFGALWLQPLEMWKSKTVMNVSRSFPRNFLIVATAWGVYGVSIGDWYIAVASFAFATAYGAMLILWYKFREAGI